MGSDQIQESKWTRWIRIVGKWKNPTFLPVRMSAQPGQYGETEGALLTPALTAGEQGHVGLPQGPKLRRCIVMWKQQGLGSMGQNPGSTPCLDRSLTGAQYLRPRDERGVTAGSRKLGCCWLLASLQQTALSAMRQEPEFTSCWRTQRPDECLIPFHFSAPPSSPRSLLKHSQPFNGRKGVRMMWGVVLTEWSQWALVRGKSPFHE